MCIVASDDGLPQAVLFICTMNAIRSPMAEIMLRFFHGQRIYTQSAGIRAAEEVDGFAIAVMEELGMDLSQHEPKTVDQIEDDNFDLVISLSPEAQHTAVELTRYMSCEVEFWPTMDPSVVDGPRETRLQAYRDMRDTLLQRIRERFPPPGLFAKA